MTYQKTVAQAQSKDNSSSYSRLMFSKLEISFHRVAEKA